MSFACYYFYFLFYRSNDLTKASVQIREEIRAVNVRNVILISRSTHISQLLRQNDDGGKSDNNLNWIVSRPESTIDLDANLGKYSRVPNSSSPYAKYFFEWNRRGSSEV